MTPLGSLTNLKALSLNQNSITNVSPLASLTNLKRLEAAQNSIMDVSSLASLTNLEYLNLQKNRIAKGSVGVSSLAGLVNLEVLNLYTQGGGFSISSLAGLTKLKEFGIGDGQFGSDQISRLVANMPNLEWLKLPGTGLTDISFLAGLLKLEELNLSANGHITDLKPLACLPKLKKLHMRRMPIIYNGSVYSVHIQYLVDNGVTILSQYNP